MDDRLSNEALKSSGRLKQEVNNEQVQFCSSFNILYSDAESPFENISAISAEATASAKVGSWIVLTEYDNNKNIKCVKAEYVDGKMIKEDTSYALINGEFVEMKQTMKYFVDPNKIKC